MLGVILLLFGVISVVGITWGLPSRAIDKYLFGDDPPWPGEMIHRLASIGEKFSPDLGADVDVDPLDKSSSEPVWLTATEEDVAKIYLRYRLFTYQPDEMITMMALAGMRPGQLDFDPRLYQYGGLFVYPIGALIKLCGILGLLDVRSDVVYYLDHPNEFGKFYVVARAYSALWGLVGVIVVFAIARRLGGPAAGLLAALLFALMPVVICMAHEGKPHLPGAVLMLMAVHLAMRCLSFRAAGLSLGGGSTVDAETVSDDGPRRRQQAGFARTTGQDALLRPFHGRDWWLMCICCGAASGMVLSAWPILVLIPLVTFRAAGLARPACWRLRGHLSPVDTPLAFASSRGQKSAAQGVKLETLLAVAKRSAAGIMVAMGVYLVTNPYILVNALANREVLRSNFGNSLAMYEIGRFGEGLLRVVELTIEGATLPILFLGGIAWIVATIRKHGLSIPLAVPAVLLFIQFVLIGAGKPAEYGRFGIFTNTALAIGTSCLLTPRWIRRPKIVCRLPALLVSIWVGLFGGLYLWNFHVDATAQGSRIQLADYLKLTTHSSVVGVLAEPAPYCCPPLHFARTRLVYFPSLGQFESSDTVSILIAATDQRREMGTRKDGQTAPAGEMTSQSTTLFRPTTEYHERLGGSSWLSWFLARETPMSWANKVFAATIKDQPVADRRLGSPPVSDSGSRERS